MFMDSNVVCQSSTGFLTNKEQCMDERRCLKKLLFFVGGEGKFFSIQLDLNGITRF